jgi:hypothetical protein
LIQTRLPEEVGAAVAFIASDEGDSVAGWVRRLIFREVSLVHIDAWVMPARKVNPVAVFTGSEASKYRLRPRREITALDRVFDLTDRIGQLVPNHVLFDEPWYKEPHLFRFVLNRSPTPWQIVTFIGHEITLHAEV